MKKLYDLDTEEGMDRFRSDHMIAVPITGGRIYLESGTVARRVGLSATRLHEIGEELHIPLARTDRGTRLWTEQEVETVRAHVERSRQKRIAREGRDRYAR
jgi:hypothetical protein